MCMRWEPLRAAGAPAVKNHTATAVSSHELLVFGGYDGRRNHNALHLFDVRTRVWRELTHETRGRAPAGRNGHTATLADRKLFLLGGWLGSGPLAAADLHVLYLDSLTWEQLTPDAAPGPCNMHTADFVPRLRSLLVFRGGDGREYLNDLHALHVDELTWRRVNTSGATPAARANHSSALVGDGERLLVFGGWDGRQRLNDVHVLDTQSMAWSAVVGGVDSGPPPLPRAGMTLARHREKLFVFGGSGPSAKCYDDLHVFDPAHSRWLETVAVATSTEDGRGHKPRERGRSAPPRWDIYEDEDQADTSWSAEDHDEADDLEGDSDEEDAEEDDRRTTVLELATYGANPNDMCELTEVDAPKPSAEDPLLVVGQGPGRRAGHTCTVVSRLLVVFGGSCGADYLSDCFALDTDPPPLCAVSLPSPARQLRLALARFVDCDEFADISFLVEGRVVFAHKLILSALSARFRGMFSSGFVESRAAQIAVPDVRYEVFLRLLEYLYTGRVETHDDVFALSSSSQEDDCDFASSSGSSLRVSACPQSADGLDELEEARRLELEQTQTLADGVEAELEALLELLVAADQFMLDHLKQRCERTLQHAVRVGSVEAIAEAAERANARQLQAVCCHFLRNHPVAQASSSGSFDGRSADLEELKPDRQRRSCATLL
ncbi:hypothetical protein BBJ28_00007462 [Nothophytophthora sp. Chile5]|nr:hypothetical protein BBJ28_00007462 [Nothophytophthora sp. Chile5]